MYIIYIIQEDDDLVIINTDKINNLYDRLDKLYKYIETKFLTISDCFKPRASCKIINTYFSESITISFKDTVQMKKEHMVININIEECRNYNKETSLNADIEELEGMYRLYLYYIYIIYIEIIYLIDNFIVYTG